MKPVLNDLFTPNYTNDFFHLFIRKNVKICEIFIRLRSNFDKCKSNFLKNVYCVVYLLNCLLFIEMKIGLISMKNSRFQIALMWCVQHDNYVIRNYPSTAKTKYHLVKLDTSQN